MTRCGAALTCLSTGQHLSPKRDRRVLQETQFDMELKWCRGNEHTSPDVVARLGRRGLR